MKEEQLKPVANFVILASQVDAFCQALSLAMQLNQSVTDTSLSLLQTFIKEAKRCFEGKAFDNLTDLPANATTADLLTSGMVLRGTLSAMLDQGQREQVAAAIQPWGLSPVHEHRHLRPETMT